MAAIPNSIPLGGMIAPTDTTDIYPTHSSNYGKGGVHHVATIVDRDAITAERRSEGMFCTVEEDGKTYQLVGGISNADWAEFVSGGSSGPSTAVADLPIGGLLDYAGDAAPADYLECDGRAVSRTAYEDLFAVIGTTYGSGDGSTTFNLPNISSNNGIVCIKYRIARAADIVTAELDYDNTVDVKSLFSESKALTIPSNNGGWSGSGYGVETISPMPLDGWITIRQLTVDSKKSIVALTRQEGDTVWQGRASFPTDPTTAQMLPTFAFPVKKNDQIMIVCISASAANKTALSVAELIPYKKVAVCGRDGASSGDIDWNNGTTVDLVDNLTKTVTNTIVDYEGHTESTIDGAALIYASMPNTLTASNMTAECAFCARISNKEIWRQARVRYNSEIIYGVKKGDVVGLTARYLASLNVKPTSAGVVFFPYIVKDNSGGGGGGGDASLIVYVDSGGDDTADGKSAATAVATISHATELATQYGVSKISVAAGTYDEAVSISDYVGRIDLGGTVEVNSIHIEGGNIFMDNGELSTSGNTVIEDRAECTFGSNISVNIGRLTLGGCTCKALGYGFRCASDNSLPLHIYNGSKLICNSIDLECPQEGSNEGIKVQDGSYIYAGTISFSGQCNRPLYAWRDCQIWVDAIEINGDVNNEIILAEENCRIEIGEIRSNYGASMDCVVSSFNHSFVNFRDRLEFTGEISNSFARAYYDSSISFSNAVQFENTRNSISNVFDIEYDSKMSFNDELVVTINSGTRMFYLNANCSLLLSGWQGEFNYTSLSDALIKAERRSSISSDTSSFSGDNSACKAKLGTGSCILNGESDLPGTAVVLLDNDTGCWYR